MRFASDSTVLAARERKLTLRQAQGEWRDFVIDRRLRDPRNVTSVTSVTTVTRHLIFAMRIPCAARRSYAPTFATKSEHALSHRRSEVRGTWRWSARVRIRPRGKIISLTTLMGGVEIGNIGNKDQGTARSACRKSVLKWNSARYARPPVADKCEAEMPIFFSA